MLVRSPNHSDRKDHTATTTASDRSFPSGFVERDRTPPSESSPPQSPAPPHHPPLLQHLRQMGIRLSTILRLRGTVPHPLWIIAPAPQQVAGTEELSKSRQRRLRIVRASNEVLSHRSISFRDRTLPPPRSTRSSEGTLSSRYLNSSKLHRPRSEPHSPSVIVQHSAAGITQVHLRLGEPVMRQDLAPVRHFALPNATRASFSSTTVAFDSKSGRSSAIARIAKWRPVLRYLLMAHSSPAPHSLQLDHWSSSIFTAPTSPASILNTACHNR